MDRKYLHGCRFLLVDFLGVTTDRSVPAGMQLSILIFGPYQLIHPFRLWYGPERVDCARQNMEASGVGNDAADWAPELGTP
jgi:hypothetical protein